MKKWFIILMSTLLLISCTNTEEAIPEVGDAIKKVQTLTLEASVYEEKEYYDGYIGLLEDQALAFKYGGELAFLHVEEGDRVKAGDLLGELKTDDFDLEYRQRQKTEHAAYYQYDQARLQKAYLEDQVAAKKELLDQGAITKDQYDELVLQYELASASASAAYQQYAQAKELAEYTAGERDRYYLYAPSDGIIRKLMAKEGAFLGQGMPLVLMSQEEAMLQVKVPQEVLPWFDRTSVKVEVNGSSYTPSQVKIHQLPDEVTGKALVDLQFSADLPIGTYGEVVLTLSSFRGIRVPLTAIHYDQGYFVYLVEEGLVTRQDIELVTSQNEAAIIEGVRPGQVVITAGFKGISLGQEVEKVE